MLDENEHSRKEDGRSLHRLLHKAEQQDATVVVDSAAFFSELPPEQAPPPRRPQQNTRRNTAGGENGAYQPPKRGKILLIVQAILSVLALVQLWRTQMLPVLYLVILAALLALALEPMPNILILDEPLSGVDVEGMSLLMDMLDEIRKKFDLSILMTTHDFTMLEQYCDQVVLLQGKILRRGTPLDVLNSEEFAQAFHMGGGTQA